MVVYNTSIEDIAAYVLHSKHLKADFRKNPKKIRTPEKIAVNILKLEHYRFTTE